MKIAAFAAALTLAGSALAFPPITRNGGVSLNFALIEGKCMPQSLMQEITNNGFYIHTPRRDGRECCAYGIAHSSPPVVNKDLWLRIQPFVVDAGKPGLTEDQACNAAPMTEAEFEEFERARLARIKADQDAAAARAQAAAKKQAEDDKRPLPQSWAELRASTHPADISLVKSIDSMKWWHACVAWGRESRAKSMSRRGHALRDFLLADKLINGADLGNVRDRVPAVGQTTCGVYSILGLPDKTNITDRAGSTQLQIIYWDRGIYVYVTGRPGDHNGTVTSVSR